jgi:hypothetical protein
VGGLFCFPWLGWFGEIGAGGGMGEGFRVILFKDG